MAFYTNPLNFPNLTSKATPVGADLVMIADSAANNALKQATLTSLLAAGGGGGAFVKIGSATASASATIDFDNVMTSTYDNYFVTFENLVGSSAVGAVMSLIVGTGSTPTWSSTTYSGILNAQDLQTSSIAVSLSATTGLTALASGKTQISGTSTNTMGGYGYLFNTQNSSNYKALQLMTTGRIYDNSAGDASNQSCYCITSGAWSTATVISSLRLSISANTFATGTVRLYGIIN